MFITNKTRGKIMGSSSSGGYKNKQAMAEYKKLLDQYGMFGLDNSISNGLRHGKTFTNEAYKTGGEKGKGVTSEAQGQGLVQGREINQASNAEAKKYAAQQARETAAGAQSQATTAARAAGMNKAQAAMLGSQQNANAYQNAYGNAYSQQLNNAKSAIENARSLSSANMNMGVQNANSNLNNQQQQYMNLMNQLLGGYGNLAGLGQQQQQIDNQQKNQAASTAMTGLATILPIALAMFSDERLKKYNECSKKVVSMSPKARESFKINIDKGVVENVR